MPSVHFDGQSFNVRGRRIWLNAAEFDYALTPAAGWARALDSAVGLGFNAIVTGAPWSLHEPRQGRFRFDGALDLGAFAGLCADRGMWLVLRVGPVIGGTYDGGGLPAWLRELNGVQLRERNPVYFERVTHWFRALADHLGRLQATEVRRSRNRASERPDGGIGVGPIVAIQIEDDWACGSPSRADAYLSELVRFAREVGFEVPLLTANRSWATVEGAVDVWTGWDDLAATTRQLAHLEPEKPRVVVLRDPRALRLAGDGGRAGRGKRSSNDDAPANLAADAMVRIGHVLAAGGQCVIGDAFPAVHRDSLPGRTAADGDGFLAARAREGLLFDETGLAKSDSGPLRRITAFAGSFGHVLAQSFPLGQPVVIDPELSHQPSVMPVTGPGGTVVFLFRGETRGRLEASLLLPDGRRLGVSASDGPVSWFALNVDLNGVGLLDYASVSPFALIERKQLVFFGPAGIEAHISIDGVPMTVPIPGESNAKPAVVCLKDLVIVVCNGAQIDRASISPEGLVVAGLRVDLQGKVVVHEPAERTAANGSSPVGRWQVVPCDTLASGASHRFAILDRPETLAACGARDGLGWYRMVFKRSGKANGRTLVHAPTLADRATIWVNGAFAGVFGSGYGASRFPAELPIPSGEVHLTMLVEQVGRPVSGDNLGRRCGVFGPLVEVAALKVAAAREQGDAVDPFAIRGFNFGVNEGDLGDGEAVVWRIQHRKKSPLLLDLGETLLPGTLVVNDVPLARVSADGAEDAAFMLDPATLPILKQGLNIVKLVLDGSPDPKAVTTLMKSARLFEVTQTLGGNADWGFARWGPPESWFGNAKAEKRVPAWMRGTAVVTDTSRALWLDLSAMGKGRAFVNGHAVGRYASRDAAGKPVAAESRVHVPAAYLVQGANEVLLFDEYGTPPKSVSLRA